MLDEFNQIFRKINIMTLACITICLKEANLQLNLAKIDQNQVLQHYQSQNWPESSGSPNSHSCNT